MKKKLAKKKNKVKNKKTKLDKIAIWKELIEELGPDEVANIFEDLVAKGDQGFIDAINQIIDKKQNDN